MDIFFAPLEGITTRTYRQVYRRFYSGVDLFFSPFFVVTSDMAFKRRDKKEFLPFEEDLVPQILTNDADAFVWAARKLRAQGYKEVNLNAGCPSGTVVSKGRGAGLLEDRERLEKFLDRVFESQELPDISIKTRAGFYSVEEAPYLGDVMSNYPFCRVIIHPRAREDYYNGRPSAEAFKVMAEAFDCEVCFNGDIRKSEDLAVIPEGYAQRVMIGRGLIADPALAEKIKGEYNGDRFREFMDQLRDEYKKILSGDRDVLFKLKEIWYHIAAGNPQGVKEIKAIMKSQTLSQYNCAVAQYVAGNG